MSMKVTKEQFIGVTYEELLEENAKLRERIHELEMEGSDHFYRTAYAEDANRTLEDENAKLRELVRDLLHHIEYPPCEGCLFEMSCAGDLSQCDEYFDWLKPRARKLGVEVDG